MSRRLKIGLGICCVATLGVAFWAYGPAITFPKHQEPEIVYPDATGRQAVEDAGLSALDQSAGTTTIVSVYSVPDLVWVAIRDGDGVRILGAKLFHMGTYRESKVPLLRPTVPGGHYEAVYYMDDGDSIFDPKKDTLVDNSLSKFVTH